MRRMVLLVLPPHNLCICITNLVSIVGIGLFQGFYLEEWV